MTFQGYVVIDTETNALPDYKLPADAPGQPRLAALAMVFVDSKLGFQSGFNWLVKPDGWSMQPGATAVNGLTDDILHAEGVPVVKVLDHYTAAICADRPVIAFNSRHDCKIMRGELRLAGFHDLFEQTPNWCVMRAAGPVCGLKNKRGGPKWPRLAEAVEFFGIQQVGQAHTAMADAMMALEVARAMVTKHNVTIDPQVHYARNHED